jgi:hypothetical protein
MPRASSAATFRLQPADPFDLIRWLARTQSDPRKAVAELVQNSIDAGACTISIHRRRAKGQPVLVIRDDGEGVLPHLEREEALRYLGTNIGHSHKLGLSPSERRERVVAGQYGVGLLGFWAIGARMEMRSRVAGSPLHVLTLREDQRTAKLSRIPHELDAPPTFTELVIGELHDAAQRPLSGRRLAEYLAAELRGPIVQSGVAIEVHDHLARGLAQKRFPVTPKRYEGIRLELPAELAVEGFPSIRLELYLSRGADRPAIQLACAGTLVADDIAHVDALGFTSAPWTGRELTGLIEFPAFRIPPATRRGVVPDDAAAAFTIALAELEPRLVAELERLDRRRRAEADRHLVDDLRKALRGLHDRLPHYDLPAIAGGDDPEPAAPSPGTLEAGAPIPGEADDPEGPQTPLFPAGPLSAVAIVPRAIEVAVGGERRIGARATDADGRVLRRGLTYQWSIEGTGFAIAGDGPRPAVTVAGDVLAGAEAIVAVDVSDGANTVTAMAPVLAVDARDRARDRAGDGIPRPELVDAAGASWRSRFDGAVWQVNAAHEDYLALDDGRARLRYLVALLGKEIVARTYAQPGAGELLEHLIAVIAHAERNLRAPRAAS